VAAPKLTSVRRQGPEPRDTSVRVYLSREARSRAIEHVAASELISVGSVRFRAIEHMAMPEPTSAGRRGLEP
jgi:hypothetical protein